MLSARSVKDIGMCEFAGRGARGRILKLRDYIGFVRFRQPRFFPNVDVYAEKGSGLDTLVGIGLPDLTVGQLFDDSTKFFFLPGDGSEEYITNDSVMVWKKMDCFHFELNDNPGVDHVGLATNPGVVERLLTHLQRVSSVCPDHHHHHRHHH